MPGTLVLKTIPIYSAYLQGFTAYGHNMAEGGDEQRRAEQAAYALGEADSRDSGSQTKGAPRALREVMPLVRGMIAEEPAEPATASTEPPPAARSVDPDGEGEPKDDAGEPKADAEDILRRIVEEWNENEIGQIDEAVIEEAREALGLPRVTPAD